MSKHTPGPWTASTIKDSEHFVYGTAGVVFHISNPDDARLIAAAPDLLAACKDVLRCSSLPDSWAEPIRAAIAKAEGTS